MNNQEALFIAAQVETEKPATWWDAKIRQKSIFTSICSYSTAFNMFDHQIPDYNLLLM